MPLQPRDMHNKCCAGRAWCVQVNDLFWNFIRIKIKLILCFLAPPPPKDICGIICAVMTWMLILYAEFVVMAVILLPNAQPYPVYTSINLIIFNMLSFLAFSSHMRTMFSDPVSTTRLKKIKALKLIIAFLLGRRSEGKCHQRNDSAFGL